MSKPSRSNRSGSWPAKATLLVRLHLQPPAPAFTPLGPLGDVPLAFTTQAFDFQKMRRHRRGLSNFRALQEIDKRLLRSLSNVHCVLARGTVTAAHRTVKTDRRTDMKQLTLGIPPYQFNGHRCYRNFRSFMSYVDNGFGEPTLLEWFTNLAECPPTSDWIPRKDYGWCIKCGDIVETAELESFQYCRMYKSQEGYRFTSITTITQKI